MMNVDCEDADRCDFERDNDVNATVATAVELGTALTPGEQREGAECNDFVYDDDEDESDDETDAALRTFRQKQEAKAVQQQQHRPMSAGYRRHNITESDQCNKHHQHLVKLPLPVLCHQLCGLYDTLHCRGQTAASAALEPQLSSGRSRRQNGNEQEDSASLRRQLIEEIVKMQRYKDAVLCVVDCIKEREAALEELRDFVIKHDRRPHFFNVAIAERLLSEHLDAMRAASVRVVDSVARWRDFVRDIFFSVDEQRRLRALATRVSADGKKKRKGSDSASDDFGASDEHPRLRRVTTALLQSGWADELNDPELQRREQGTGTPTTGAGVEQLKQLQEFMVKPFVYNGVNYVAKMQHDLHFLVNSTLGPYVAYDLDNNVVLAPRRRLKIPKAVTEDEMRRRNFFARMATPQGTLPIDRRAGAVGDDMGDLVQLQQNAELERGRNLYFASAIAEVVRIRAESDGEKERRERKQAAAQERRAKELGDAARRSATGDLYPADTSLHGEKLLGHRASVASRYVELSPAARRRIRRQTAAMQHSVNMRSDEDQQEDDGVEEQGGVGEAVGEHSRNMYGHRFATRQAARGLSKRRPASASATRQSPLECDKNKNAAGGLTIDRHGHVQQARTFDDATRHAASCVLQVQQSQQQQRVVRPWSATSGRASSAASGGLLRRQGSMRSSATTSRTIEVMDALNLRCSAVHSTGKYWWSVVYHICRVVPCLRRHIRRVRKNRAARKIMALYRHFKMAARFRREFTLPPFAMTLHIAPPTTTSTTTSTPPPPHQQEDEEEEGEEGGGRQELSRLHAYPDDRGVVLCDTVEENEEEDESPARLDALQHDETVRFVPIIDLLRKQQRRNRRPHIAVDGDCCAAIASVSAAHWGLVPKQLFMFAIVRKRAALTLATAYKSYYLRSRVQGAIRRAVMLRKLTRWMQQRKLILGFTAWLRVFRARWRIHSFFRRCYEQWQQRVWRRRWRNSVRIQRWFRIAKAKELLERKRVEFFAAREIQRRYRGVLGRRRALLQRRILCVQTHVKTAATRRLRTVVRLRRWVAAWTLQRWTRCHLARMNTRERRAARARELRIALRIDYCCVARRAIAKIWAWYRRFTVRRELFERFAAERQDLEMNLLPPPPQLMMRGEEGEEEPIGCRSWHCLYAALSASSSPFQALRRGQQRLLISTHCAFRRLRDGFIPDFLPSVVTLQSFARLLRARRFFQRIWRERLQMRVFFWFWLRRGHPVLQAKHRRSAEVGRERFLRVLRRAESKRAAERQRRLRCDIARSQRMDAACVSIQAAFRGFLVRSAFRSVLYDFAAQRAEDALLRQHTDAALTIQHAYRACIRRREERRRAAVLRRALRGMAATVAQRFYRDILHQRQHCLEEFATYKLRVISAFKIQIAWRTYCEVKHEELLERERAEHEAQHRSFFGDGNSRANGTSARSRSSAGSSNSGGNASGGRRSGGRTCSRTNISSNKKTQKRK